MTRLSGPRFCYKEAMEDTWPYAFYPFGSDTASNTPTRRVSGSVTRKIPRDPPKHKPLVVRTRRQDCLNH